MAIMGFLVHTSPEDSAEIERRIGSIPEITTYGIHQESYIVAVAEAPGDAMEAILGTVQAVEGVLAAYVTSLTVEDELPEQDS